jgi:superfamily II DNA or RNA helicase
MSALFVEKVLDEETFATGAVVLAPSESERLGLPSHPTLVRLEHGGEVVEASWTSGERRLGGDAFRDLIELNGQVEGLLRLHAAGDGDTPVVVQFLERPRSAVGYRGLIPVTPKAAPRPTPTASTRSKGTKGVAAKAGTSPDRNRIRRRDEFTWYGPVGIGLASVKAIKANAEAGGWDLREAYDLRVEGEVLGAVSGFDELLALDLATVDHMPHQEATALKVLSRLRGRAVLADEVGLGKTIEAGLIMKELIVRGLAKRVLIVCPASLREQWQDELREKFHEDFELVVRGTDDMAADLLIISRNLATREVERITKKRWDLVIVDEAHLMTGPNARKSRDLLQRLDSRYALYLTATPVQNDLLELYRLVDSLRPGTFTSQRDFSNRFMGSNPREPKNPQALRELISDVMVRTTRAQAGLDRVARIPQDFPVTLPPAERQAYDLCVGTLRQHMNDPGDHFRRRHLALRLTTSPRALGQTARRMASSCADPKAGQILAELADLCAEFGITARQEKLLSLVNDWVDDPEKGRVLIFTQHTDTLDDLLRVLDLSGVEAVPFHGTMSPDAKQKAIRRFRAGKGKGVPVMISTESGAVGLNLQFANCVVNYDLPWNPMRIEQRIGRVHRVTQTRDVYVANLFARDTIDESVYRLLHDKLKMFELLFGQVTTILGELDDADTSGSFQNQILDALLARDDTAMTKRIEALGQKVERAYASAQQQMEAGGGNLTSLIFDTSHRAGMKKGGASELAPAVVARERQRRAAVERFVRRYLEVIGADITWESKGSDSEPGFLSARLPDEAREALGGRSDIHLAFGGEALANHADAELCAVGTEVFEQIVQALADHGDLLAEVPDEALAEPEVPWFAAGPGVRFVSRSFADPTDWSTETVWKVRNSVDLDGDDVVTALAGDPTPTPRHRPLRAGESLPAKRLGPLIDGSVKQAIAQIREVADVAQRRVDEFATAEQGRLAGYHEERLHELQLERSRTNRYDRIEELDTQIQRLKAEKRRVAAGLRATAEVQADLLALRFVASPVLNVVETWEMDSGVAFTVEYPWDIRSNRPETFSGADGEPVTTVARCADGHVLDESRTRECPGCGEVRCPVCVGGADFSACDVCATAVCHACLGEGVCGPCADPLVEAGGSAPVTLSLGHGASAQISHHRLVVRRASGEVLEQLTPLGVRVARTPGLRDLNTALATDLGLARGPDAAATVPDGEIELDCRSVPELHIDPIGGPAVSLDAAALAWPQDVSVASSEDSGTNLLPSRWVTDLVTRCGLAPGPAIVVETVLHLRSLAVADGELVLRRRWVRSDGFEVVTDHETTLAFTGDRAVLRAPGIEAAIRRNHRSLHVDLAGGLLLLAGRHVAAADEEAIGGLAAEFGAPEALVVVPDQGPPLEFASPPAEVELVSREVEPVWASTTREPRDVLDHWPDELGRPQQDPKWLIAPQTVAVVQRQLGPHAELPLDINHRVTEHWRSPGGEARVQRVVPAGDSAFPVLDDTGVQANSFEIDAEGHLHEVGSSWDCPTCHKQRCRACGVNGQLAPCPVCDQPGCGFCLPADATDGRVTARCAACGVGCCTGCGRNPDLSDVLGATFCWECRTAELIESNGNMAQFDVGDGARAIVTNTDLTIERSSGTPVVVPSEIGRAAAAAPAFRALLDLHGGPAGARSGVRSSVDVHAGESELDRWWEPVWRLEPSGDGRVDPAVIAAIPGSAMPVRSPEPPGELDEWAAKLRADAGLDPVPSLVLDHLEHVRALAVVDGWPALRHRIATLDGGETSRDDAMEVRSVAGHLALCWESTTIPVRRLHTSFAIELPDTELLVLGPGRTEAEEYAADRLARSQDCPDFLVGVAAPSPEPDFAVPFGDVELVERSVSAQWVRADRPLDRLIPLDILSEVTGSGDSLPSEPVRSVAADTLYEELARLLPPAGEVVYDRTLQVHEIWRSLAGVATVDRLVASGDSALPLLDDSDQHAASFSVDTMGHLHEVDAAWSCEACGGRRCRACGSDGALGDCGVCGQEACGFCRTGHGTVTGTCAVCARADCTACARHVELASCGLCHRSACERCMEDGTCRTCGSLELLSVEEQVRLPEQLVAAHGPLVFSAEDRNARVLVLKTDSRLELVLIAGGEVREWRSAGRLGPPELALTLGAGRSMSGVGDLSLVVVEEPAFTADADGLVVSEESERVLLVSVLDASGAAVHVEDLGPLEAGAFDEHAVVREVLERKYPTRDPGPVRCDQEQVTALQAVSARMGGGRPHPKVRLSVVHRIEVVKVAPDGLIRLHGDAHRPESETARWDSPGSEVVEYWAAAVPGTVAGAAAIAGRTVALVAAGPHRFLATRASGADFLYRLDELPDFPTGIAVADWLGTGSDLIAITGFTTPEDQPTIQVEGAQMLSRRWHPVTEDAPPSATPDPSLFSRIVEACPLAANPALTGAWPSSRVPTSLRAALLERFSGGSGVVRRLVNVGYRAEEEWTNGEWTVAVRYERRPGELRPAVDPAPGRVLGPVLHVDRARHLADVLTTCPYCTTETCAACDDRVRPCPLCDQLRCGSCAAGDHGLCLACAALERVGSLARRRLPDRPRAATRGKDHLHEVIVVPAGGGNALVTVQDSMGERRFTRRLSAGVAARLDQLTNGTSFT